MKLVDLKDLTPEQLKGFAASRDLTPEERAGTILSNSKLAMSITPYFFNLIDPADEHASWPIDD